MNYEPFDESKQYKLYPQRFLVTGLFALAQLMSSVMMNTLTPIASDLSDIYGYTPVVINLGGLLYILMHPIFTFPAAYVIDSKGTRAGIVLGSVLGIVGASLRMLVNQGFWLVIAGQILAGIGRPFILNCQAKISGNWFHATKRGGVTQLLTLVLNISLIVGILIPGIMFKDFDLDYNTKQQGRDLTFKLMLTQAIMSYIFLLPNILFQLDKPPTPPSESGDIIRQPFNTAIKKVSQNRNFMLLLVAFGLYFGMFNAISISLSFLLQPWFGGDSLAVSLVGGAPVISGIIGVVIIGQIQRKQGRFKKWIIICMIGSCIAMLVFYPILETESIWATCLVSAENSFFLIPLVPIMLELGCELVFPVGEGAAVGLLFAAGNLFGFFLGLIMSLIVDGKSKGSTMSGLIFCLVLFVTGLICAFVMKEQKNREKAQRDSLQKRRTSGNSNSIQVDLQIKDYVPPKFGEIDGDLL